MASRRRRARKPFPSRSLWDRQIAYGTNHTDLEVHVYDSNQFKDEPPLRVLERDVKLPGSPVRWRFQVAQSREQLDAQINALRRTLVRSFLLLALGLIVLAGLQTWYGLRPLRRLRARNRAGCAAGGRRGSKDRCPPKSRRWSRN